MLLRGKIVAAWLPVLFCTTSTLLAQEPSLPSAPESPAPSQGALDALPTPLPALPTPLPNVAPVPLPTIPPAPDLSQLDAAFKKTSMGQVAEEYRLHVEWRKLQNEAAVDPQVIAAKQQVAAARTDLEKRKRLRIYYDLFYGRMRTRASAPDVKAYVDLQKAGHLATTAQDRVRPGGTPAPKGPTPTPSPTPTPTPMPKSGVGR